MIEPPALPTLLPRPGQLSSLTDLAAIPEEEVWLASQKSARTRRAYKLDVAHFMRTLGITTPDMLRQVDHRAVIAWARIMREEQGAASRNPVADGSRPAINRDEGSTAAFSKAQARNCLTRPQRIRWLDCATALSFRLGFRSGFAGQRLPR